MAFDFKKEYKEFYMPKGTPEIVTVPAANYIAVRGKGNPNQEGGAYQQAVGILYAIAYTIKMSYKGSHKIEGFFEYDFNASKNPLKFFSSTFKVCWDTLAGSALKSTLFSLTIKV